MPDLKSTLNQALQSKTLAPLNNSIIALIPKVRSPSTPKDFRPISIINGIQKILSKVLANRLAPKMQKLVSQGQSGFIKGRTISENFLYAQTLINHCHKTKIPLAILKADLHKAFDAISWDFIHRILTALHLPQKFCNWILNCVLQGSSNIIINGIVGRKIVLKRGVRQGDALSPLLFVLAFDFLAKWLNKLAAENQILTPFQGTLPALFYADDSLLFFKPDLNQAQTVTTVLNTFYLFSGLKLNPQKSELVTIHTERQLHTALANVMGCNISSFPITYLGLPLSNKRLHSSSYTVLFEKFSSKLEGWSATLLSQAGRVVLINSVLSPLVVYFMSVFQIPTNLTKKLDKLRKDFFWKGTDTTRKAINTIAWKRICKPKKVGGLGIKDLTLFNKALLYKWLYKWNAPGQSPIISLWLTLQHNLKTMVPLPTPLHKNLNEMAPIMLITTNFNKADHEETLFWFHNWGGGSLCYRIPTLFSVTTNENITLSQACQLFADGQLQTLINVDTQRNTVIRDEWEYLLEATTNIMHGAHSEEQTGSQAIENNLQQGHNSLAAGFYKFCSIFPAVTYQYAKLWKLQTTPRVKLNLWKIFTNALPTNDMLIRKGWIMPNFCVMCLRGGESVQHLFEECAFFVSLKPTLARHSIHILNLKHAKLGLSTKGENTYPTGSFTAIAYHIIWKERCRRIFNNVSRSTNEVSQEIQLEVIAQTETARIQNTR